MPSLRQRLTRTKEPETRALGRRDARFLDRQADSLASAKLKEESAKRTRREVRDSLADEFGFYTDPGTAAYHVRNGANAGELLSLGLNLRFEADMRRMKSGLSTSQVAAITVEKFSPSKAEQAIKMGVVTADEIARYLTVAVTGTTSLKACGAGRAYRFIEAGSAQVKGLKLHPRLKTRRTEDED